MLARYRQWAAIAACAVIAACSGSESPQVAEEPAVHDEAKHEAVHWGYEGAAGPGHWAELSAEFAACAGGREQSPIDLTNASEVTGVQFGRVIGELIVNFDRRSEILELIDNGHTIQVTPDAEVGIVIEGVRFGLAQFHFHAPSEHLIEGVRYPLEAHFVMSNAAGELAVLGILYEEGEHDPAFDVIMANLPVDMGDARHIEDLELDIETLKPLPDVFYAYSGSLTTPPCSEGVRWFVIAEPEELSAAQIEAITSHLYDNARPLQPLNERKLLRVTATD
jgi:carbonic anhydrase